MNCKANCDSWGFLLEWCNVRNHITILRKQAKLCTSSEILPKPSEDKEKHHESFVHFVVQKSSYSDQSVTTAEPMENPINLS